MNTCPCCSSQLLRHARHNRVYWFCPHCWQEMPNLSMAIANNKSSLTQLSTLADQFEVAR